MLKNKDNPEFVKLFELAFQKRPGEELYDLETDPYQLNNLALESKYEPLEKELEHELNTYLEKTADPRAYGKSPWDNNPFYFEGYTERFVRPVEERDTIINGTMQ